jgi:hypothetical protein
MQGQNFAAARELDTKNDSSTLKMKATCFVSKRRYTQRYIPEDKLSLSQLQISELSPLLVFVSFRFPARIKIRNSRLRINGN